MLSASGIERWRGTLGDASLDGTAFDYASCRIQLKLMLMQFWLVPGSILIGPRETRTAGGLGWASLCPLACSRLRTKWFEISGMGLWYNASGKRF